MDLLNNIKELCAKYDIKPQHSKGQNFLVCENVLDEIVEASDLNKNDIVLEIGPGFGTLTKKLAERAKKVVTIELDKKLLEIARKELKTFSNVDYVNENVLNISYPQFKKILGEKSFYKIAANLPYNITGAFFKKILSMPLRPQTMTLMLQKEVAERICEKPGKMSILSVSTQYYTQNAEVMKIVPKSCFFPVPEVDSAILKLKMRKDFLFMPENEDEQKFLKILKIGFSARRKMLKNNLVNGLRGMGIEISGARIEKALDVCGLDIMVRAQELSVDDWKKLSKEIN